MTIPQTLPHRGYQPLVPERRSHSRVRHGGILIIDHEHVAKVLRVKQAIEAMSDV